MRSCPVPCPTALLAAVLALAPDTGRATAAQAPPAQAPRVAAVPLEPPNVELGEEFRDAEYGFLFRLPKGMSLVPPDELAAWRKETLLPADQLQTIEGKRVEVQGWLFKHPEGGSIFVLMNEPPVQIETPLQLRQAMAAEMQAKGRPYADVGKLYEFRARGGRTGFLVTRDFGIEGGKPLLFREHVALLRGPQRSFLVRYTAPTEDFDRQSDAFQAAMITFAVERGTKEPVVPDETATKSPSFSSPRTIANVAILALFALGGVVWRWRAARRPAPEGA